MLQNIVKLQLILRLRSQSHSCSSYPLLSLLDLDISFLPKDTLIDIPRKLNPLSENINEESGFESAEAEVHL